MFVRSLLAGTKYKTAATVVDDIVDDIVVAATAATATLGQQRRKNHFHIITALAKRAYFQLP